MTHDVNNTKPRTKFGRAFNAAIGADWMITEEGLRTLLAIAARLPVERAVEGYDGEPLEYTRVTTIRDGVAIIPVDGPIFRYANWFTYFSGGASVDVLGKDFISALENAKVSAILFEINSPGGEVTGINEFCEMVYAARSKKPVTARVGGLGCSAAYWLASACGDIAIDETATLGSIGVMAVYTDDRKALMLEGIEEIEFISSQSPFKNAAPWTDEGRGRIQNRVDALAQVFVEKVARNRGVSVETVLADFGQGDVLVGQAAVDAGLADRLDSFESSVYLLNRTHNPYFEPKAGDGSASARSTIKEFERVDSPTVEILERGSANLSALNGEFMEAKDKTPAAETTDESAGKPAGSARAASSR